MIFLDTCILIDHSKREANIELRNKDYCISTIVQLEFKAGALNKRELKKINRKIYDLENSNPQYFTHINKKKKRFYFRSPYYRYN